MVWSLGEISLWLNRHANLQNRSRRLQLGSCISRNSQVKCSEIHVENSREPNVINIPMCIYTLWIMEYINYEYRYSMAFTSWKSYHSCHLVQNFSSAPKLSKLLDPSEIVLLFFPYALFVQPGRAQETECCFLLCETQMIHQLCLSHLAQALKKL